jgi:hypothetical protein
LDENFARLITTFDEVPLLSMRAKTRDAAKRLRPRLHDKGVDQKRKTAEVSSGPIACGRPGLNPILPGDGGPQGLRRPRFSFF